MNLRKTMSVILLVTMCSGTLNANVIAEEIMPASNWVWSELKENISEETPTDPRQDFHLYANKEWILENEIPAGYASYSHYQARQTDVDNEFLSLLTDETLTSDLAKSIQSMYQTILNWEERNRIGYAPVEEELEIIESIENIDEFFSYITDTSVSYPDPLFSYYVSADLEDSTKNIFYVGQKNLMLGDAAEYSERTSNGQLSYDTISSIFKYMMERMGRSEEDAASILENVLELESKFAAASYTTEEYYAEDIIDRLLNKMTVDEFVALCPNYPMMDVLKSIEMDQTQIINVEKPEYFKALNDIVTEDNLQALKDLYILKTVYNSYSCLDEETYRTCTNLANELYGIEGTLSDEEMARDAVKEIMPIQCQQLYVEVYGSEEKRELITQMCQQVIDTYAEMLQNNDYLSKETIEKAVEKLNAIKIHSLYPDKWPDVSSCDFTNMSYLDALTANDNFLIKYNLAKDGTNVDKEIWIDIDGLSVLDCNAFYNPYDNSINMIMGMMGAPFYRDDMSIEELYASLGAFWIGHEVSHAFDSLGSQYDKDGNYMNWWTEEDRAEFDARIVKLDEYLSAIEVGDGNFVKGTNVDTEMVADYTGLQCALKMAEKIEDFDYDKFFTTYANMNASIATKNDEISLLLTDSHPLNYLRTNVPVQQFEEFYQTYDVKEGDGMYLAPEDRLLVW